MTREEARAAVIGHWLTLAEQSLAAAREELAAGRVEFSVNRAYYACFYGLSAVLLREGRRFVKHRGVRAAMHEHLVKPGKLGPPLAHFYDELFDARHEADYGETPSFDAPGVGELVPQAEAFVAEMRRLLESGPP